MVQRLSPPAYRLRIAVLAGVSLAASAVMLAIPPFAQPLWYHDFADQRCLLCIPHMLNVVSNVPFVIVGLLGLRFLLSPAAREPGRSFVSAAEGRPYGVFFACIALTGFGSAYYHSDPNNERLLWDRLPLALAFMAFLAIMIAERVSLRAGRYLFWPLVALGGASVIYWHFTEVYGVGDLRIYLLVPRVRGLWKKARLG